MKEKSEKSEMTRKEVLVVVHRVYVEGVSDLFSPVASEEVKALCEQVHGAFHILDGALHSEQADYYCPQQRHFCSLRLSNSLLACIEQLKAEQKREPVEAWERQEVTQC